MTRARTERTLSRVARGFSLMEMMLVLTIIGILAGAAAFNLVGTSDKARVKTTKASLVTIQQAIDSYYGEFGRYPSPDEGMGMALVRAQILQKVYKDAWKEDFLYYVPHPVYDDLPYEVISKGSDRTAGTDDDISIWTADEIE